MSRLLALQKSFRQLGEIRMGDKGSKGQPQRLTKWRLTSPDRSVLDAAALAFGGEVSAWKSPTGDEWQVYTDAKEIPVIIAPRELLQAYEEWSAAGLQKRCDGEVCSKADGQGGMKDVPCMCDPDNRTCKLTTRFSVFLPDLPAIGIWKVESHGFYAATELPDMVETLVRMWETGQKIQVMLGIEEREVKRPGVPTKKFIVPYLKPLAAQRFGEMLGLPGYVSAPALEAPSAPALPAAVKEADPYEAVKGWMLNNGVNKDIWTAWKRDGVTLDNLEDLMNQGMVRGIAEISQAVAEIIVANQKKGSQEGV